MDEQVQFNPVLQGNFPKAPVYVCGGMGGSALPALAAQFLGVQSFIVVHRDYGLPPLPQGAAAIALSYSGNTEETRSFAQEAHESGLALCIIAAGGELLRFAEAQHIPSVQVPAGLQPRDATVLMTRATLAALGEDALLQQMAAVQIDVSTVRDIAAEIVAQIGDRVPVFYASTRNEALAYMAKIHCNETGKIPAFSNVIPELNHNEMQGFGGGAKFSNGVATVFMRDPSDSTRIQRRMELTQQLYADAGVHTLAVAIPAESRAYALVYTLTLVHAIAQTIAEHRGVDPEAVPLIETFKKEL